MPVKEGLRATWPRMDRDSLRMVGLVGKQGGKATSLGALRSEDVIRDGVRGQPDVSVIATRKEHEAEILIWNYHDDDLPAAAIPIDLLLSGLPTKTRHGLLEHFRLDFVHSNAFTVWKEMGSPQSPTEEQYEQLQRAGQLQLLTSPAWTPITQGAAHLQFALPRQGLSLVRISWE